MIQLTEKEQAKKDYENALDEYEKALEELSLPILAPEPTLSIAQTMANIVAEIIIESMNLEILKEPDTDK